MNIQAPYNQSQWCKLQIFVLVASLCSTKERLVKENNEIEDMKKLLES